LAKIAAIFGKALVALEKRIAEVSWTKAEQRYSSKAYNPFTVSELGAFALGIPWKQFLTEARNNDFVRRGKMRRSSGVVSLPTRAICGGESNIRLGSEKGKAAACAVTLACGELALMSAIRPLGIT
jgi:hypothetical protein